MHLSDPFHKLAATGFRGTFHQCRKFLFQPSASWCRAWTLSLPAVRLSDGFMGLFQVCDGNIFSPQWTWPPKIALTGTFNICKPYPVACKSWRYSIKVETWVGLQNKVISEESSHRDLSIHNSYNLYGSSQHPFRGIYFPTRFLVPESGSTSMETGYRRVCVLPPSFFSTILKLQTTHPLSGQR